MRGWIAGWTALQIVSRMWNQLGVDRIQALDVKQHAYAMQTDFGY